METNISSSKLKHSNEKVCVNGMCKSAFSHSNCVQIVCYCNSNQHLLWGRPKMMSRICGQFLTTLTPLVTRFITKACILLSQNPWPAPPSRPWRHFMLSVVWTDIFTWLESFPRCWMILVFLSNVSKHEFMSSSRYVLIRQRATLNESMKKNREACRHLTLVNHLF